MSDDQAHDSLASYVLLIAASPFFSALGASISSSYRQVADFRDFVIYQRAPAR